MKFTVEKMTCGHCVKAVHQALQEADSHAQIKVNLADKNRVYLDTLCFLGLA